MSNGWIGVDLDGTLAHYDGWRGRDHIGEPIAGMVRRVQQWLAAGREVRIFTARAYRGSASAKEHEQTLRTLEAWCVQHLGQPLPVTCTKDYGMVELWDDRAVRVTKNTGEPCCQFKD